MAKLTMVDQKQPHHLLLQHPNLPIFKSLSQQKKIGTPEKQTGSCLQPTTVEFTPWWSPWVLSPLSMFLLKQIFRNICFTWLDFVVEKVSRRDSCKTLSSSTVITISFHLSGSNDYTLRNFKKIFSFHNGTIMIINVKVSMSMAIWILNFSNIDIVVGPCEGTVYSYRFRDISVWR